MTKIFFQRRLQSQILRVVVRDFLSKRIVKLDPVTVMIKMHQKILIFTHINVFYHNEITYRFKFICYIKDKDHLRIGKFQMEIFNLDWSSVSMKLEYRLSVVRRLKIPFYPSANFVSLIFLKKYLQQKKKNFLRFKMCINQQENNMIFLNCCHLNYISIIVVRASDIRSYIQII